MKTLLRLPIIVAWVACSRHYLGDAPGALDGGNTSELDGATGPSDAGASDAAPYDAGPPNDSGPGKTIFATSTTFTGNLGGLGGADAKCAAAATVGMLPGVYRAWLSMPGTGNSVSERLARASIPYRRPDGFTVANDFSGLLSGALFAGINLDEKGNNLTGSELVWTNTKPDGNNGGNYCSSWGTEVSSQKGKAGKATATNALWTYDEMSTHDCNELLHLYCVEQ